MTYNAPLRDMRFVLNEVLDIQRYSNLPGFSDAPPDVLDAILDEGAKIAEEVLQPLNAVGDKGCTRRQDGSVEAPKGFKDAYRQFVEGGWVGLTSVPEFGGQGLPAVVGVAFNEMISAANMAFAMYPGLTHGAYSALLVHGSDELKKTYLPNPTSRGRASPLEWVSAGSPPSMISSLARAWRNSTSEWSMSARCCSSALIRSSNFFSACES